MSPDLIQTKNLALIVDLAKDNDEVEVVWLYGSRARGKACDKSDYDLAIVFKSYMKDPIKRRLRPELLALEWRKQLAVDLSIIDFNQASIQLAYAVVQDNSVLYSNSHYKLMVEEQKIMSKWELDHLYHRKHFA